MTQIAITQDYSLFKRIKGNRKTKNSHINRLIDSISKFPELMEQNPIIVNEKFEVIDGNHRLEALKKLEMPVPYVQAKGARLKEVQQLNSKAKQWTFEDYARSYAELGNENYKTYLSFLETYKLGKTVIAHYLSLKKFCTKVSFIDGKFEVSDEKTSHKLCQALLDIGQFHPNYNTKPFSMAFRRVWMNKDYSHKRMLDKMDKYGRNIDNLRTQEDYLRALEEVYNKNMSEPNRVRFY